MLERSEFMLFGIVFCYVNESYMWKYVGRLMIVIVWLIVLQVLSEC